MMKMYALLRNDIWMSPGKAAAQAGHAFVHTTLLCVQTTKWLNIQHEHTAFGEHLGTRVVLGGTLDDILDTERLCQMYGLPHYRVVDEGHIYSPDFDGKPIITALGFGPLSDVEQQVFAHLPLYDNRYWRHVPRRLLGYHFSHGDTA